MRFPLIAGLVALAPAAQAERLAFDCQFTQRCNDQGCSSEQVSYSFRYDTSTDQGGMNQAGAVYPVQHFASSEMHHFLFVNDAGSEIASIAGSGQVVFSGHMTIGGTPSWYRLEGQCTGRSK